MRLELLEGKESAVRGNPVLLRILLRNLIDNALQHASSGGHVLVRTFDRDTEVVMTVEDGGPGIPESERSRVFERFYRVDKSRSRPGGGSGIGLTIARHLVEAHGGQINAASAGPGQGSTFTFTLPVER